MRAFIDILKLISISALFFILLSFSLKNNEDNVREINLIEIEASKSNFVNYHDILPIANNKDYDFDVSIIEQNIKKIPQIKDAQVYLNHNGSIDIKINQRVPILRIYDNDSNYYLDEDCEVMPISRSFTSREIIVSGDIDHFSNDAICNLYSIIRSNDFYKSLITQIHLKKNNVVLATRIKNFEINIGDLFFLEKKFNNLMSFYNKIIKFKGWEYYDQVNLKYIDQIICSKK